MEQTTFVFTPLIDSKSGINDSILRRLNSKSNSEQGFDILSDNFTADSGKRYGIDTRIKSITSNLPLSPLIGDAIFFVDAFGSFSTNHFIINGNGKQILRTPFITLSLNNDSIGVFYNGEEWRLYE